MSLAAALGMEIQQPKLVALFVCALLCFTTPVVHGTGCCLHPLSLPLVQG